MGLLERGLDRGAKRFGIPLAYIEVSPVPPS